MFLNSLLFPHPSFKRENQRQTPFLVSLDWDRSLESYRSIQRERACARPEQKPRCLYWPGRWRGRNACKQSPAHCCHSSFGWSRHAFTSVSLEKYQQNLCYSSPVNIPQSVCVNVTELSFLTCDWCQIRGLDPFLAEVSVRFRSTSIIPVQPVKSMLKLQEVLTERGTLLNAYGLVLGPGAGRCEEFASSRL